MQQLLSVWNALDAKRRTIVALAGTAMFLTILALARLAGTPGMALLYSGLDPASSGEVVAALEQQGVAYEIRGSAIFVDSGKRDVTRMTLASEGLPTSGTAGYELLDNLSGFSTTAQMFDAAYWRAREGELARTILAWPQVKTARVHIANPVSRPFAKAENPVASVTLKLTAGPLSESRVQALRFLVASAVVGLSPENVSVIDSDRGLLRAADNPGNSERRADQLKQNVERLLSARVGTGNAVVEVTIDTARQSETIVERRFDPDSRVAISTETTEIAGDSSGGSAAAVTVASNLPAGDAATPGTEAKSSNSETRERVNYEVSETTRELIKPAGMIRRLSVAVMVNGIVNTATDGSTTWQPRPDEELATLRELVESTVGYDATRGDVVTVKSMQFQPLPAQGTEVSAPLFTSVISNAALLIQTGILALAALALGLFVLRPILTSQPLPALPDPVQGQDALAGIGNSPALLATSGPEESEDPVARLRQIISERQEESLEVLQNWIATSEERV